MLVTKVGEHWKVVTDFLLEGNLDKSLCNCIRCLDILNLYKRFQLMQIDSFCSLAMRFCLVFVCQRKYYENLQTS